MEDLSNKPISYTGSHPLERDYRALRARLAIAEAERDEYKLQRDKWIADEPAIEAEAARLRDANGILSEALEATRSTLEALTARVAELEAQLAAAGSRVIELEAAQDESYHAYLELKEEADSRGEPLREACRQNMILTARVALAEERTRAAVAASLASAAAVARIGGLLGVDPSLPVEEFRETVIARVVELTASSAWLPVTDDEPPTNCQPGRYAVGQRIGRHVVFHFATLDTYGFRFADGVYIGGASPMWAYYPPAPDTEPTP